MEVPSLGIIGGASFLESDFFDTGKKIKVRTRYGPVNARKIDNTYFIQRHTEKGLPLHKTDFRATIAAFRELEVKHILGVSSVASTRKEIRPGSVVVPHDFISFQSSPTFFDREMRITVPTISQTMREKIFETTSLEKIKCIRKAIHVQRAGPVLETRAETNMFRNFGEIIGTSLSHEAILAKEAGMEYAGICMVDHLANGIAESNLKPETIRKASKDNAPLLMHFLNAFLKNWNGSQRE